jgi:hypothetical protein
MDGEFIMVAIIDSDQLIETRGCRLVHLPDGTRAALWRGLAWPVSAGDRIDIAGPAFPLSADDPPTSPRFGLIDGAEEAWLVLDGSVTVRDAAATALRHAGIAVLRSGPWLGDPVDGVFGTSFVRFVRPAETDLRQSLARILEDRVSPASARPDPAERARVLLAELMEARAELARVRAAQGQQRTGPTLDAEAELARMQGENVALLREIADLHRQLAAAIPARPERSEPSRAAGRLQDEITALLTTIRPDLRFLRDSLTVLAGEFADRRGPYRAVLELGSDALGRGWKRIHGAPGWWERHVSNGQDGSGRIYAQRANGSWHLLISHKSEQARDIVWLAKQTA